MYKLRKEGFVAGEGDLDERIPDGSVFGGAESVVCHGHRLKR